MLYDLEIHPSAGLKDSSSKPPPDGYTSSTMPSLEAAASHQPAGAGAT